MPRVKRTPVKICLRAKASLYGELKKPHNIVLTDTAWERLKSLATQQNIKPSEYLERWLRQI
ncbi:hypothetical protein H6F76_02395 [Leptolyngbya sp. FACHB-321]|uniref:hypothetical protein n=1 Tax=Leptolyngbya sp. FACHB-321 TaxID=2692807 RepID=UPI00168545AB|nr:hypothetical protein [Leptolyngbya sp. FACHB-321]MBD2033903.1 hypothetical protein [Leptolyngbya sp. FACHB-321]